MRILLATTFLLLPFPLLACGSPTMYLAGYWDPAKTPEEKIELIEKAGCTGHVNYEPNEDDLVIAAVAIDAIQLQLDREVIEGLLQRFHCAYAARHESSYEVIRSFIGEDEYAEFCDVEYLDRVYIVQVRSGATLRDAPGADGKRLNAIRKGAYVEVIAEAGNWYQVDSELYGQGFIYKTLLQKY